MTYPAAFLLTVLVLLAISFALGIVPFGEKSLVVWDANVQYVDFLAYFRRMLLGEAGWKYTFSKTFGGDMAGFTGYYLNSPFNLAVLFFENWEMPKAFQLIYFLKIACCAVTCQFYFNSKKGRADWPALIFSVTYGLTAYHFAYGYNIMWLDAVILLPLLAAGIERIAAGGKGCGLYVFSLTAGLYTCYYMGYMLCGFSLLYFIVLWLVHDRKNRQKLLCFGAASAVSAGLSAFFLLPVYFSLSKGADRFGFEALWMGANFHWRDLLGQFVSGGFRSDQIPTPGLPPVFLGVLVMWLVLAFFLDRDIPAREKLVHGVMLSVFLVSMWSRSMNIVWQGFAEPNGCNYRYAFFVSFFCLSAAKRFWDAHEDGGCRLPAVLPALAVSLFLAWRYGGGELKAGFFPADVLLLPAAALIFSVRKKSVWLRGAAAAAFLLVQMADLGQNGRAVWELLIQDAQFDLAGYARRTAEMNPVAEKVSAWCEKESCRMELNHYTRRSYNDSMQYGYAGLSHYSSTEDALVGQFEDTIGLSPWLEAEMPDEFTDSLMGVRYRISLSEEPKGYPLIETDGMLMVYENPRALPLIFAVTDTNRQIWDTIMEQREWGEDWPDYEKLTIFRKEKDDRIRCEAEMKEAGRVLTTIPYDTGWVIRVDGKKKDISVWLDTFLAFDMDAGTHEICFDYRVKGQAAGIGITVLTIAACIFLRRRKGAGGRVNRVNVKPIFPLFKGNRSSG